MPCSVMDKTPQQNMYVFSSSLAAIAQDGSDQCLAKCNPALYHMYDHSTNPPMLIVDHSGNTTLRLRYLSCVLCTDDVQNAAYSCNGSCADGYYYNASSTGADCIPCTTAPCAAEYHYRQLCLSGISVEDAKCLPCPNASLYNNVDQALQIIASSDVYMSNLEEAVSATRGLPRRAWLTLAQAKLAMDNGVPFVKAVPSAGGTGECAMRCMNNYAWVDVRTGMSPFKIKAAAPSSPSTTTTTTTTAAWIGGVTSSSPNRTNTSNITTSMMKETPAPFKIASTIMIADGLHLMDSSSNLVCLSCASVLIAAGQGPLYSYWNGSLQSSPNARLPPTFSKSATLGSMSNVPGGCFMCQDYYDVDATSTQLCELLPGYTAHDQGDASFTAVFTTVAVAVVDNSSNTVISLGNSAGSVLPPPPLLVGLPPPSPTVHNRRRRRSLLNSVITAMMAQQTQKRRRLLQQQQLQQQQLQQQQQGSNNYNATALPPATMRISNSGASSSGITMEQQVQRFRVRAQPVPLSGDYFTSCVNAGVSAIAQQNCKALQAQAWEQAKTRVGSAWQDPFLVLVQEGGRRRRRSLLQMSAPEMEASQLACFSGSYKPERGSGSPCYFCPSGSSTSAPNYFAATSLADCVCAPGYYSVRAPSSAAASATSSKINPNQIDGLSAADLGSFLITCVACPDGTYRSPNQDAAAGCIECPTLSESVGMGSAYCYCVDGAYAVELAGGINCQPCPAGFYCNQQGKRTECPPNSISPEGSKDISDCVCNPQDYYGVLSASTPNCMLRPPAVECKASSGVGAAACGCAAGWAAVVTAADAAGNPKMIHCRSGCAAGTYAAMQPHSQALAGCLPCPSDTYAVTGEMVGAQQCTACPPGKTTAGKVGCASMAECMCADVGLQPQKQCSGCNAGWYLDISGNRTCVACPAGMLSVVNSIGPTSCKCPPGQFTASATSCAPCVRGTYSHTISASCMPCPPGYTTAGEGATSLLACRPSA